MTGNLAVSKLKEATICAREALSLFPRSSEAYLLMGSVFAVTPNATGEVSLLAVGCGLRVVSCEWWLLSHSLGRFVLSLLVTLVLSGMFGLHHWGLVCTQCLSAYAKALQLNPLSKAAALGMAEVLIAAGKAQEAVNW